MYSETKSILKAVADGSMSVEEAELRLKTEPFTDIGYAKIDLHRKLRQGAGEVIYGAGKTANQIAGIIRSMTSHGQHRILVTRLAEDKEKELCRLLSAGADNACSEKADSHDMDPKRSDLKRQSGSESANASESAITRADAFPSYEYHALAGIAVFGGIPAPNGIGTILVATGGTSDIPVAEEAALTAEFLGNKVNRVYDVGVAGLHRLLPHIRDIASASVIIAIAGMEGALASVIGGLSDCPVIAVPTSVGYGASFGGISALLSMLNSCASGVSVVNIDNGFGAGFLANRINHMEIRSDSAHTI